jgi:hypothetical protein
MKYRKIFTSRADFWGVESFPGLKYNLNVIEH